MATYRGAVIFSDVNTWDQVGPVVINTVEAANRAEAMQELRKAAWDELDSRINDVTAEVIHVERL